MRLRFDTIVVGPGGRRTVTTLTKTADNLVETEVVVPKAVAGTLTTRTSNTAGVVTVTSHTLQVGDKVDVYFAAGRRATANVDAVTGTTITFSGGDGPNFLPAQGASVQVGKQDVESFVVSGDQITSLVIDASARCHVAFYDAVPAVQSMFDVNGPSQPASGGYAWNDSIGTGSPMAGFTSATVHLSTADTTKDQTVRVSAYRN